MKRINILSLVLPLLALLFVSCSLETDNDAGKMEGMWHLVKIESITTVASEDLSEQVIFWSFQAKLLQMDDKTGMHNSYLYRFRIGDNQLTLTSPYQYDRENGDHPLTAYESTLGLYGIKSLTPVFRIEKLDRRKMILNDDSVRLYFDKF
ncbi:MULTISPECIES: lipocalin-like domain-containing protein [Prevotella]|uniref:Lipocalin-like domain-containing protein n=1 Tax=Prevotella melaninogenica TaxID=28132 RepID=A0ABX7XQ53_9BACT|nr:MULTISPECIES: lipocalin-like domain-containing protein [Prevotella]QUB75237.1 lipocalin-like domain-containing protein [Prevotella melaninogenica]